MTKASIIRELGLAYSFRGLVHYHHGREHGAIQVDMLLEKWLREFYIWIHRQQVERDYWPGLGF